MSVRRALVLLLVLSAVAFTTVPASAAAMPTPPASSIIAIPADAPEAASLDMMPIPEAAIAWPTEPTITIPTDAFPADPDQILPLHVGEGRVVGSGDMVLAGQVLAAASLDQVVSNVRTWIVEMLAGLATLFLTIGGLRYLMAGGDPAEVEKAKTALKSSMIGYSLAVLAPVLLEVLKSMLGA